MDSYLQPLPQEIANQVVWPQTAGHTLSAALCGFVCSYSIDYFQRFGRTDKLWLRCTVGLVTASSITSAVLAACTTASEASRQDRTQLAFAYVSPPAQANSIVAALCAAIVQTFFALRAYMTLPRPYNYIFGIVVGAGVLTSLGAGMGGGIHNAIVQGCFICTPESIQTFWLLQEIWCYSSAATDLLISAALIVRLKLLSRSTTGGALRRKQQPWISRLISVSLGTAAITSAWALAAALAFAIAKTSSYFVIFVASLPQTYALCCLYVLRSRQRLLADSHDVSITAVNPSIDAAKVTPGTEKPNELEIVAIAPPQLSYSDSWALHSANA